MEAIIDTTKTNSMSVNNMQKDVPLNKPINTGALSNGSTTSDNDLSFNDINIINPNNNRQFETNGVSERESDGHLSQENLHVSVDSNIELNEIPKENEEDSSVTKKYKSEIARLETLVKSYEAKIEVLENRNKKLGEKERGVKRMASSNSESANESDEQEQPERNIFKRSIQKKSSSNPRKRGRPSKNFKPQSSPRKSLMDEQSSASEPREKKGRGRPTKISKKTRGRPKKQTIDDSSSSVKKEDDMNESKDRRSRGRPRKVIDHAADNQNDDSGDESKEQDASSEDDSEPPAKKPSPMKPAPRKNPESFEGGEVPDRKRGRPKKAGKVAAAPAGDGSEKRGRGRPKSNKVMEEDTAEDNSSTVEKAPSKSRGRPKKATASVENIEDADDSM